MRAYALPLLLTACTTTTEPPTTEETGTPPFTCDQEGFVPAVTEIGHVAKDDLLYYLGTTDGSLQDLLWFEMYFATGAPTDPGSYPITDENYRTCGLCVTIIEDCDGPDGYCGKTFLAQSGTVQLDTVGLGEKKGRLEGKLVDVELVEVTIDWYSATSTVVDGGETRCLDDHPFSGEIAEY